MKSQEIKQKLIETLARQKADSENAWQYGREISRLKVEFRVEKEVEKLGLR